MIRWVPSASVVVLNAAWPEALRATLAASVVVPSVNETVPAVTGVAPSRTVAVNVTLLPVSEGLGAATSAVVVATAASSVVIVRLQPPLMLPTSPVVSSTMYRLHVPLGVVPLNAAASVALTLGAGAGAGNESGFPTLALVGL